MTDENDNYDRTGRPSPLGALLGNVDNVPVDPMLGKSPEWWEQREREVAHALAKDAVQLELERMTKRAGELRDEGFPDLGIDAALGQLADTTAMRIARGFLLAAQAGLHKRVLILAGGVGAGKTTAATWVALKGQDPRPGFIRISELERRGRYDKKLDEFLRDKTSLVIDDVGAEVLDGKGVFRSLLDEIVDKFYAGKRTLVMTTNLRPLRNSDAEPEQFRERYGERVWSRCSQLGEWGECGTRDLRKGMS